MEFSLIYTILIILSLSVALNFKLTFSLMNLIKNPPLDSTPLLAHESGEKLPNFKAKTLSNKKWWNLDDIQQPVVFLYLSSRCPKCQEKLPEIEAMFPVLDRAGLTMNFISEESERRINTFLKNSPLLDVVLLADKKNYKMLNPTRSSPFYLLIDHLGQLQAGGMIGDNNWMSFLSQMEEIKMQLVAS